MSTHATRYRVFCAVSPGLEQLLFDELSELHHLDRVRLVPGGCEVRVDPMGVWQLVLESRIAESIRVRVGHFRARNFDELRAGLARVPWAAWLPRGGRPEVRVTCRKSKLWHSGAVQQRAQQQICDRLSTPDSSRVDAPRVYLRLERDQVHVSVDASGALLHRRGQRTSVGKASMRETLAAAVLRAAGLPRGRPLWDPFCGAGTLLLEAYLRESGEVCPRPEGYAFELWPTHDAEQYAAWLEEQVAMLAPSSELFGSDIDTKEISAAQSNLERAGASFTLRCADFAAMVSEIPLGADVVSNLPYGRRASLEGILGRLRRLLAQRGDLDCWFLLGSPAHAEALGLGRSPKLEFRNGGIRVGLYHRPAGADAP